jgi:putative ABC transport system permease protein
MVLQSVLQDVGFAARQLRRSPVSTTAIVITLSLGIGANAAIFSLVNAWLLRPLPLKDPQQLVSVWRTASSSPHEPAYFDFYHDYLIWASDNHTLRSLAATFPQEYTVTGFGEPRRIHGAVSSWNLFATVGAGVETGRLFVAEDVQREASCVISYAFWKSHFGGSRDIVGRMMKLNETPYRILGVLLPKFSLRVLDRPFEIDAWTLINVDDRNHSSTSSAPVSVIGRLKSGVTAVQAEADLNAIQRELNRRFPDEPRDSGVMVAGLQSDNTRTIRSSLLVLLGAVCALLLIACVNVGSLILGKNSQRATEFAVRLALGCSPQRLLQQLTTEVLLLFVCGGFLGVAIAVVLLRVFAAANPLGVLPPGGISVDTTALATTAFVICVTGLLFGSVPAIRALRLIDADSLRARATTAGPLHLRSRMLFVSAEVALSVMLLVSAGLLISSLARLMAQRLGFDTRDVYVGEVALSISRYPTVAAQSKFINELLPKLRALPSVQAAGVATIWPFQANALSPIEVGRRPSPREQSPQAFAFDAGPGYFSALGIPLLRGRDFSEADRQGMPDVALINEAMAQKAFPGEDPVGKRIRIGSLSDNEGNDKPWLTVIGVIGDTCSMRYNRTDWDIEPAVYTQFFQRRDPKDGVHPFETQTIYIYFRAQTDEKRALAAAAHEIDPDIPIQPLRTTGQIVNGLQEQPQLRAWVLGSFASLTLLLAMVGVYGVMTQFVEQRRREIGVRIALGATAGNVVGLILQRSLLLILGGLIVGIAGAVAASRLLRSLLYQVSPSDPLTFAVVLLVLPAIAVRASYVPAKRATRIDPNVTLRCE